MLAMAPRLQEFLDEHGVEYEAIHHRLDYRACKTAQDTHTPPGEFAKTVFVRVDGRIVMAVLPASKTVALGKLRRGLGARDVQLAREWEFSELCPDCEPGAAPPFGNLYDLPVYVSPALTRDDEITFNAGSHEDAVRMAYGDFERLVKPRVLPLSRHDGGASGTP
jgi:Ala-tRNA(Pro) deacylase